MKQSKFLWKAIEKKSKLAMCRSDDVPRKTWISRWAAQVDVTWLIHWRSLCYSIQHSSIRCVTHLGMSLRHNKRKMIGALASILLSTRIAKK